MSGPLVVLGDALLDKDLEGRVERLTPEAPVPVVDEPSERARPGGAALAATLAAAAGGAEVILVSALGDGERGRLLGRLLDLAGVEVIDLGLAGDAPEKVRVRAGGHTLLRIDRGGAGRPGALSAEAELALAGAAGVLVADYGRGLTAEPSVQAALERIGPGRPVVWDPHPKGATPVPGARLVTPNRAEAAAAARLTPAAPGPGAELAMAANAGRRLLAAWRAAAVAVTLGARGALLVEGDTAPRVFPAPPVAGGDPCGAGDRFAAAAAAMLAGGALVSEAVAGAVAAASHFVAGGGAAAIDLGAQRPAEPGLGGHHQGGGLRAAQRLAAEVRARGGTVVSTGGCFDLLHAGHVASLRAARALGDCLIVCLNSDASVRRRKGAGRPLVTERDRAAVLAALDAVDAVVMFDEATPARVLDQLRPDVFAKGGDYALAELPEADLLAAWGGQAVILPYLEGRSTTRLLEEARSHGQDAS